MVLNPSAKHVGAVTSTTGVAGVGNIASIENGRELPLGQTELVETTV